MKQFVKSVLFVVLAFVTSMPAWGQASTEGKEFWITLLQANSPENDPLEPYLAISTKEACVVTVSNPQSGWSYKENGSDQISIPANTWKEIKIQGNDLKQWYNDAVNTAVDAGIKVTATENVSVFVASRLQYSFDASNILPITALQSEYIIQDYPPYNHGGSAHSNFAIVGTGTNLDGKYTGAETEVKLTLYSNGVKGNTSTFRLKPGQVYYIKGGDKVSLSGSHIQTDNMKVAVFNGVDLTDVPGPISARDNLYEQAMPVDYWGTEFIVTRSLQRDANRIRITAQEDGTHIFVDKVSKPIATIDANQTYELELSEDGWVNHKDKIAEKGLSFPDVCLPEKAHYIRTSCPCAVYSYDVGNDYQYGKDSKATVASEQPSSEFGDPSMVWISPLEQSISEITFGVMGTDKTHDHYLNVITPQTNVASMQLLDDAGNNTISPSDFAPVKGKPDYYYMRKKIAVTKTNNKNPVFTLKGDDGFIAHVYGHGEKESYAYSAGSSAVSLGSIAVGDTVFKDGGFYQKGFCVNDVLTFDASAGSTVIDKVEWDFGDGTSEVIREASVEHEYTVKGWYDVTAKLYAHKNCPDTVYPPFTVNFTFRVNEPPTIQKKPTKLCMPEDYDGPMDSIGTITYDCDSIVVTPYFFGKESSYQYNDTARDVAIINGVEYTSSQDVSWETENEWNCPHHITCHLVVVKCLDLQINNDPDEQHTCMGENYELPFSVDKDGFAGKAYLVRWGDGERTEINLENTLVEGTRVLGTTTLPIEEWPAGKYSVQVLVRDSNCHYDAYSPELNITVNYPQDVFTRKFNNVLAVYAPGNGGNIGYDFRSFQWYRNGEAIWGANNAVYYSEQPFQVGESYYIELTDAQGLTLPSCEMIITEDDIEDYTGGSSNAPKAEKKLVNQQLRIVIDDREYDMYGQRVE